MFKSSLLVMIINMLSRILGLIREILIGSFFGATGMTDAYFGAFKISNFFTQLLGEGALGSVFIPLYNEKRENEGKEKADDLIFSVLNLVFVFSTTVSIFMILFSEFMLKFFVGFKDEARFNVANNLLKIMAFYFLFISLSGIVSAVLNNFKRFLISTSTALVFNLTIICGVLLFGRKYGIYGLGVSVLLSGLFQLLMQLPQFFMIVKKYKFVFNIKDRYIRELFLLMIPTLVGIFGYQINEMIDTRFAAALAPGTVSALNYSSRLYLLPIGVFAISLSVVIFPNLSQAAVKKQMNVVKSQIERGMNMLAFFVIPSQIVLMFYAKEIVSLIYKRGAFREDMIIVTSQALTFYSAGLLFFSTIHLLTRSHYVFKDRKRPVMSSFAGISINIILDFLLYKHYKHMGLTFATSTAAMVNYLILLLSLNKNYIKIDFLKYIKFIVLTLIISGAAYFASTFVPEIGDFRISIIIKLIVFAVIYLLLWAPKIIKQKINMFG
jgi:putative peptidoglycan lipid II flippase